MVYYGVKDAYLIDIHSFRRSAAVTWLADCCHTLGLDTQRVMVLMLDSDCFFVNIAILREKLHHIEEGTLDVLVIDLDADPVSIKAYSDCTELQEQLTRALPLLERYVLTAGNHPQPVSGSINTDKEPYTQIGSPFLAGLLLGYPCVYLAKPEVTVETGGPPKDEKKKRNEVTFDGDQINEEDNDNNNDMKVGCYQRASGKLSYSLLSKVTTSVRLKFKTDLEEFGTHLVGRQIPLLEFTYPQYLMENVEEDVDHLITTAIEKFRGVCAKKYETFEDSNDFLALESRIFLNEEVISTEVISL